MTGTKAPAGYMALFTSVSPITEVSGGSYARAVFDGPVSSAVTFPKATSNWGSVVAFGVYDAPVGGHLLFWKPLGFPNPIRQSIPAHVTASFAPGNLDLADVFSS